MKKEIMEIDYDHENDIIFAFLDDEIYKDFEYSEFLNDFVSIDFNENNIPIGIEISNASQQFKTKKQYLNNIISGGITILISKKTIELNINLLVLIHNKSTHLNPVNIVENNDFNLPLIETTMAMV